jgi:hypothetical protein
LERRALVADLRRLDGDRRRRCRLQSLEAPLDRRDDGLEVDRRRLRRTPGNVRQATPKEQRANRRPRKTAKRRAT